MNIVIVTLPPSTHERLSAGMLARNQPPRKGINTIGARKSEACPISSRRASRSSGPRDVDHHAGRQGRDRHGRDRPVQQRRPEARVEETRPDTVRLDPAAGRELERQDSVDPEQAEPRRHRVKNQQRHAASGTQSILVPQKRIARDHLDAKERPFGGPEPVEFVDHHPDRARADLDRGKPHRHAGQGPQHEADQHQGLEVAVDEPRRVAAPAGAPQPLEVAEEHPAADRHLCQKNMKDPQPADHHPLHQRAVVLDRVI